MGFVHQFFGANAERKTETLLKADGAQNARGIIDKRERMQNTHKPALKINETAPMVVKLAIVIFVETQREGVNGEIAAVQIELNAAARNSRERGGAFIKFGAGGNEI